MELKGDVFCMDGKRRILIVIFLDCTQVSSRKKHGKAGRTQEASKDDGSLPRSLRGVPSTKNREAALLPDFLCFILDATWIQPREITIEMLFFPSISKKLSFAFNVVKNSIHPSYRGRSNR
jgi:hypothetical protein